MRMNNDRPALVSLKETVKRHGLLIEEWEKKIEELTRPRVPILKVKRLHPDAVLPTRGTPGSAGLDLYAIGDVRIGPEDIIMIRTGLAFEIPAGYFGMLVTRSSLGRDGVRVAACTNIIDSDYRQEVLVYMRNDGIYPKPIRKGDRYAQIILVPVLMAEVVEADELSETSRTGGFGSTGR